MHPIRYGFLLCGLCAMWPAHAVEFWHSDTVWAGQGMCAASFTFDSGMEPVSNLRVSLSAIDEAGHNIDSLVLDIPEFGSSSAERYVTELWESDTACDDNLTLLITSASATIDGKRQDLLKSGGLRPRLFKPFTITLDAPSAAQNNQR